MNPLKKLWVLTAITWVVPVSVQSCGAANPLTSPSNALQALELSCKDIVENIKEDAPKPEVKSIRDACAQVWIDEYKKGK